MYEIKDILNEQSFIETIEFLREEKKKAIFLRYCKAVLVNFSSLHIKEIWKDNHLLKYSYYWFSANNDLIIGWDNAPHHKEIKTFPHHKHTANGVLPSSEKNLTDVIGFVNSIFRR